MPVLRQGRVYDLYVNETTEPVIETRRIATTAGVLEVQMTQRFIDHLRQHFGLLESEPVDDDRVRMYVWGAVNTAVNKAEREMVDAGSTERVH